MTFKKGFTLIELLVVMGIMAVLAAGIVVAINPADKLKAAADTGIQSSVGQAATAGVAYAARNGGFYPNDLAALVTNDDLVAPPAGVTLTGTGGTGAADRTGFYVYGTLTSSKYSATTRWLYNSSNGKTCAVAATVTVCP